MKFMKRKAFIIAAVMALVLTSCTREEIFPVSMEYGEPVNATLTIGVTPTPETVVTKASSGNDHSALNSLLLVFFDASYNFKTVLDTASGDLTLGSSSTETESNTYGNSGVQYTAEFTIASGTYYVVGIGNYTGVTNWTGSADGSTTFATYLSTVLADLANGDLTYTQFLDKIFYVSYSSFINQGLTPTFNTDAVLLTGCNSITVPTSEGAATNPDDNTKAGELELYRGIANIEFNVTQTYNKGIDSEDGVSESDDNYGNIVTFTPSTYAVYNVPKGIRLNPSNSTEYSAAATGAADASYYYDTGSNIIGTVTSGTYTFNFFMPENIQAAGSNTTYATREAWSGTYDSNGKKNWTNAPTYATYVVISGTYTETDASGTTLKYRGTVSYTIHLGDFSQENSYNYGDFTVKRNYSYTYNITVRGVDDIITEVETSNDDDTSTFTENSPGAEGSIYALNDESYYYVLDSHFEQVILSYNLSLIVAAANASLANYTNDLTAEDKAIGENIILQVESPFQSGTVTLNPYTIYAEAVANSEDPDDAKSEALDGVADYKWIEFWPQSDKTIAAYPGVPAWNGGTNNTTTNNSYLMDAYDVCVAIGKAVKILMNNGTLTTGTSSACDNIILSDADEDGTVDHAYFTGFVDEYYYFNNPINGDAITWGDFADKDSRRMIISMNNDVSSDGNSSYNTVRSRIVQRSIQTIYDTEYASTLNGFGIETYNESGGSGYFGWNHSYTSSDTDGLLNFTYIFKAVTGYDLSSGSVSWSTYLQNGGWTSSVTAGNGADEREIPDVLYQSTVLNTADSTPGAWYACLSRNRDLDGDGYIDSDEIYWYLPAIEEYTLTMLGESALSNESRLYFGDKSTMVKDSYPSAYLADGAIYYSSSYGTSGNKRMFWAVERGSYAAEGSSYGGGSATDGYPQAPLRCARRLPTTLTDTDCEISEVCTIRLTDDGNYVADLRNYFEKEVYRTSRISSGLLNAHNEDDSENKLYYGFVVPKYDSEYEMDEDSYNFGSGYVRETLSDMMGLSSWTDPCGGYYEKEDGTDAGAWRVPNLSELIIISQNDQYLNPLYMGTTLNTETITDNPIACCTQFSNQDVRLGFRYVNSQLTCINLSSTTYSDGTNAAIWDYFITRCVRDATEDELNATAVTSSE